MQTRAPESRPRKRGRWKRWLRTLHIQVSVFGMVLLLFFAATGFIMNHEDWFEVPSRDEPTTIGQIPVDWLAAPDRLAMVELLRQSYGVTGPLSKFETEDETFHLSFRKPGRSTDVEIFRDDGYMTVEVEIDGFVEAMTMLHKGKSTGIVGTLLVDLVAVILALTAIGGLTLWTTLPARRSTGLVSLGIGIVLAISSWWFLVL